MASRNLGSLTIDLIARTFEFEQGMDKAARKADKSAKQISGSLKAIGVAAAASTVAIAGAAVSWSQDVSEMGVELERLSKIAGTSFDQFQHLAAGANAVGVSTEKLADIYKDVQDKVGDFMQTGGGPLADFFKNIAPQVGVTAEQFTHLSGPDALGAYVDALEKAHVSQNEMTFYLEAIASDATQLLPLLRDNSKGFKEWAAEADRLGATINGETQGAIKGLQEQSAKLDLAFQGLKIEVAENLLPVLNDFTEVVGSAETGRAFGKMVGWVGSVTAELISGVTQFANYIDRMRQLQGLAGGMSASSADTDALNERLGKAAKERRDLMGWDPITGDQKQFRQKRIDELTKEMQTIQREVTKRIQAEQPIFDVATSEQLAALYGPVKANKPASTGTGKGAGSRSSAADFFGDDLELIQQAAKAEADARKEFEAWSAQLSGPVAAANYQYQEDLKHLSELARVGAVSTDDLAKATADLTKNHEAEVKALQAQLDPSEQLIKDLQFELDLLGKTNKERAVAIDLSRLGADATEDQARRAKAAAEELYDTLQNVSVMDDFRDSFAGFFEDVISGNKSITDSFKDMLDDIGSMITKRIAQNWVDQLFGQQGSTSTGSSGQWGEWISTFASWFAGGKANGGWADANSVYEVNERGFEMANVRGRQYMLTGDAPVRITPNHQIGGGGITQNITNNFVEKVDRRTRQQVESAMFRAGFHASRRNS